MKTLCCFVRATAIFVAVAAVFSQTSTFAQFVPLGVTSQPVGTSPAGVEILYPSSGSNLFAAVALSGDNSVAIIQLQRDNSTNQTTGFTNLQSISVPQPYGIASCDKLGGILVTSPGDGSITPIKISGKGPNDLTVTSLQKVKVGPNPYSAACMPFPDGPATAIMSTSDDDTLVVLDLTSMTVRARIPNVPGSRGLHGVIWQDTNFAWISSVDKNVTTIVNVTAGKVLGQIPIAGPMVNLNNNTILLASAAQGSVFRLTYSAQLLSTNPDILTPHDIVNSQFVSTGNANSVLEFAPAFPSSTVTLPGIDGALGLASGSYPMINVTPFVLLATSPITNSLFIIQNLPSPPVKFSVVNGASFSQGAMAPGSLASAFAATGAITSSNATSVPLGNSLAGVTLNVGGILSYDNTTAKWSYSSQGSVPAPLLFAGPNQVNFQIPQSTQTGDLVPLQLHGADGSLLLATMKIVPVAPGIFSLLSLGTGQGAVLNQDYTLNFGTNPASRGSVIQIFATGAGATSPVVASGVPAPQGGALAQTVAQPAVSIGGKNAIVEFSGLAPGFVGLWQINAVVPPDVAPGSALMLTITAGGVTSNTVTIAVK